MLSGTTGRPVGEAQFGAELDDHARHRHSLT
jgi:hypothetical protein